MKIHGWLWVPLALLAACASGGGESTDVTADPGVADVAGDPSATDPAGDTSTGQPDWGEVAVSPETAQYVKAFVQELQSSKDMTTDQLLAKYYVPRPYLAKVAVDALKADNLDLIDTAYTLTQPEKDALGANGFFVSDRVRFDSHPMGYLEIYQKDLPVLVTTDSILFAIHKSYDLMLKTTEEQALIGMLDDLLAKAHAGVPATAADGTPTGDAWTDVDLFYTVARSLLKGAPVVPVFAVNVAPRDTLLAQVDALTPVQIELFGRAYPCGDCLYDFSQFKPRGHYTDTPELQQYFRAMIWLGRTELAVTRYQRELLAAYLMYDGVKSTGGLATWHAFDHAIQVFVGKSDNLTMDGLAKFLGDQAAGLPQLAGDATGKALMAALEAGGYADQRIMSQIMMTDPMSDTPTPLPPIFEFLGQRFVVDSYVFSSVVYDRIVFQGEKQLRYMPSPLDPMFVLGFQEALPLLKPELDTWHYAQNLDVLKYLVDSYDAAFWGESMYNTWLDAIRSLGADTTAAGYPDAARTLAYAKKSMNAGMASWAELRHDTILYVKQSYTGEGCDYPDGYVEPFPDFFKKISAFATASKAMFDTLDLPASAQYLKPQVAAYFDALSTTAAMLQSIADVEVAQQPRTPDQTAFLKSIVKQEGMCGGPPFSGWYRDLFWDATDTTFEFKPTVADVHTDPNEPAVLHVATGRPNLMVFVANTSCGTKAYAGPASSYFDFQEPGFTRLTDAEWMARLAATEPARPAWTSAFLVGK